MDEIFKQLNAKNIRHCGSETDANGMSSGVEAARALRGGEWPCDHQAQNGVTPELIK
jgi:hypothetical protein